MLKSINLNKILVVNWILVLLLSVYTGRLYFLPSLDFLLIDFIHSIDYPTFWDSNPPFYSILPFNTLICIIFKKLYSINKLLPFVIVVVTLVKAMFIIYDNLKFDNIVNKLLYTILFLFLSPVTLALYTGNIAILTIPIILLIITSIENKNIFLLYISVSLLICLKFNFLPLFLFINILLNKTKFKDIFNTLLIIIFLFLLFQIVTFQIVSFYDSQYRFEKIIQSFYAYRKDYIAGAAGVEFRYWFFSYFFKLIKKFQDYKIEVFVIYAVFILGLIYSLFHIYFKSDLLIKLFLLIFIVLYFNLATTLYWYCILVPFLYLFLLKNEYKLELILLIVLMTPKFLFIKNYPIYDSALVLIAVLFYIFLKFFNYKKLWKY